jgi:hypothetical protein
MLNVECVEGVGTPKTSNADKFPLKFLLDETGKVIEAKKKNPID